jgi:hypothetical protein
LDFAESQVDILQSASHGGTPDRSSNIKLTTIKLAGPRGSV